MKAEPEKMGGVGGDRSWVGTVRAERMGGDCPCECGSRGLVERMGGDCAVSAGREDRLS